jgi:hypothetical protein
MRETKLNIDLLKRLKTRLMRMRHRKHFNMKTVAMKNECGTAMCIAGHTLDLEGYRWDARGDDWFAPDGTLCDNPLKTAAGLLGIPPHKALSYASELKPERNGLFYRFDIKTPKQAAARIQELIDSA